MRLLWWSILIVIIGMLAAPSDYVSPLTKILVLAGCLILSVLLLATAPFRWAKRAVEDTFPHWDEVKPIKPILPQPPFKQPGSVLFLIGMGVVTLMAKRT